MFDAFEVQTEDASALGKRLVVSFGLAAVTLVGLGVGVAAIAARPAAVAKEKQVDVSFRPPPPPPEPVKVEPPPPPKPRAKPPPPVVVEAPPPAPAAMVAPKEVPKEKPKESETVVEAIAVAVGGTGNGKMDEAPAPRDEDESEAPVIASAGKPNGPVNLPEDADPPVPSEDNAQPEYPESARTTGQEAKVVLKIVVEADGQVGRVQVLKGEEPFVSAALAVVRTWTYEPATLEGVPITVFKIVNITFSLRE